MCCLNLQAGGSRRRNHRELLHCGAVLSGEETGMLKIFKYLKESKWSVLAIIALLVVQAYCDLALPQYTADIVDVGIGQKGIETVVPERMRGSTYEVLGALMTQEEKVLFSSAYRQEADGNYVFQGDQDTVESLEEALGISALLLSMGNTGGISEAEGLRDLLGAEVTDQQLLQIREQVLQELGESGETLLAQRGILFVQQEYESLGMDMGRIQTDYLLRTGGMMLVYSVVMMATAILVGLLASRIGAKLGLNLRERVFTKVVSFSHGEMEKFSTASLITRSTNDIQQVQMVVVMMLRMVVYAPIIGVGGVVKVLRTRTGMGWIIVVAVALILGLVGVLMGVAMPRFKKMQTLVDRLNLVSREILTGVPVIRAFSREKFEEERFDRANRDLMSTQLFTGRVMTIMMPAMMLIMNGISIMIVWFGAQGIDLGNLMVGDMLAFITYTMQIVMSFLMLTMISVMLPRAGVAVGRIQEVIDTQVSIVDLEQVRDKELGEARGVVAFEDVSFRYPGADEDALEHLTFTARPR